MIKAFAAAWRFLTAFPFLWPAGDDEGECLRRAPAMFPLVGLVLGIMAAGLSAAFIHIFPPVVAAALVVAALSLFSLGLHMDGLADCADALMSPGRSRERILEVMKDSRIGAHGAFVLALSLLIKFAAFASLDPDMLPGAACAAPIAGRAAMLFPMVLLPYARPEGLGKAFGMDHPRRALLFAILITCVCLAAALGVGRGVAAILLWLAVGLAWTWFLRRRLGGATGDCYGAACEFAEITTALAASLRFGGEWL
jgi:adenosylcobinamide-GDP ribazoletransferase